MKGGKIEIDLAELKEQVAAFLTEVRSEEGPEYRVMKIVREIRRYKAVVVMANTPRAFLPVRDRTRLREHREAFRAPEAGLTRLREWLTTRDSSYVVGPGAQWRLDDADWEQNVWTPLARWVERGYALLFEGAGTGDWPHPIGPHEIKLWEADEQELEWMLMQRIKLFLPLTSSLSVDPKQPFTIWSGEDRCYLGDNASFTLMELLIRAKGGLVTRDAIAHAMEDELFSDMALRKAVSRLKGKLRKGGLGALAERIKSGDSGKAMYLAPPSSDTAEGVT